MAREHYPIRSANDEPEQSFSGREETGAVESVCELCVRVIKIAVAHSVPLKLAPCSATTCQHATRPDPASVSHCASGTWASFSKAFSRLMPTKCAQAAEEKRDLGRASDGILPSPVFAPATAQREMETRTTVRSRSATTTGPVLRSVDHEQFRSAAAVQAIGGGVRCAED